MGQSTPFAPALPTGSPGPGPARYLVGLDAEGHWVARDAAGRHGGLFSCREAALRYARHETDRRPDAVRFVPAGVALDLYGAAPAL